MKRALQIVLSACLIAVVGMAQTPSSPPKFDAASIKLHPNCTDRGGIPPPGRLRMVCTTARDMVMAAYSEGPTAQRLSVLGGPPWIDSDMYDVDAKPENANATVMEMYGPMLRGLLEDRFHVKVHKEVREVPIYSLVVGKNGPKLRAAKPGSCVPLDMDHLPAPGQPIPSICGRIPIQRNGTKTVLSAYGITLPRFAGRALLGSVDRPVFDKTGIEGMFDIHLEFSTDDSDLLAPSIYLAVQDQLGLKLVPDKGPMEVLVIDQIERPSEN